MLQPLSQKGECGSQRVLGACQVALNLDLAGAYIVDKRQHGVRLRGWATLVPSRSQDGG